MNLQTIRISPSVKLSLKNKKSIPLIHSMSPGCDEVSLEALQKLPDSLSTIKKKHRNLTHLVGRNL